MGDCSGREAGGPVRGLQAYVAVRSSSFPSSLVSDVVGKARCRSGEADSGPGDKPLTGTVSWLVPRLTDGRVQQNTLTVSSRQSA